MKKLILALLIAVVVSSGVSASDEEFVSVVTEAVQDDVGEGETITDVKLSERVLTIYVDLADDYPISRRDVMISRVGSITDSVLELEQYDSFWDKVAVDFGEDGSVYNSREKAVDDGYGRYFEQEKYFFFPGGVKEPENKAEENTKETAEAESKPESKSDTDENSASGQTVPEYSCDVLGDGMVQYSDGVVSYSWDSKKYDYSVNNGYFEVSRYIDGVKYTFSIIASQDTMPDSIKLYAANAAKAYYTDMPEGSLLALSHESVPGFENYVCAETGVNSDEVNYYSHVYGVTDMKRAFVIALTAHVTGKDKKELHEKEFADGKQNFYMLGQISDLVETLQFE